MRRVSVFFLMAIFFMLSGCKDDSVKIMYNVDVNTLHLPVAEKLGYFKQHNINLVSSHSSASKFSMDALIAGSVDYAVLVDMNFAVNLFNNDNLVVLSELSEPISSIKILAKKDRGILRGEDLKGKKIGVLFGVNIHLFLIKYLEDMGLTVDDVRLVNMRPPDYIADFRNPNGTIDAIITWQPNIFRLQKELGDNLIVLTEDNDKYWKYYLLLVTTKEHLSKNRDEAMNMVRAVVEADEFISANPDKAIKLLADFLLMSENEVASFYHETQYRVQLTHNIIDVIQYNIDWLNSEFYSDKIPVYYNTNEFSSSILKEISPERYSLQNE